MEPFFNAELSNVILFHLALLDYEKLNLLKSFGPVGGLLVNYGLLILCLIAVVWWERRFLAKAKSQITAQTGCGCN